MLYHSTSTSTYVRPLYQESREVGKWEVIGNSNTLLIEVVIVIPTLRGCLAVNVTIITITILLLILTINY